MVNKSAIFSKYNKAKKQYRGDEAQIARLNRALGIALSPKTQAVKTAEYAPQAFIVWTCKCEDHQYRGGKFTCKHQLAVWLTAPEPKKA